VKVGEQAGNMWIITQGLKLGERVVVAGVQKVKAGIVVDPKPSAAEPAPTQAVASSPSGT
jgi:membrane fusion protein (multidrug efflux system)